MSAVRYVLTPAVVKRNLAIALVVGIVLTATNQFDAMAHGPLTAKFLLKVLSNFVVPFIVSSVSASYCRV